MTDDTRKEMDYIISKMLSLRLFPDQQPPPSISTTPVESDKREALPSGDEPIKQWTQSVRDIQGEILIG
jgi:D-Tyr-tRNAtyr deacylase